LDSVDKVIWILPFLAFLDVISTLYLESLGYPLAEYETGLLARFFVLAGLTYLYAVVYLPIVAGFAYVLWYIKNRGLGSSGLFDKGIFLFLVGVACFSYMRLTDTFIGNFFMPYIVSGRISRFSVALLTYLSAALTLSLYVWHDVAVRMKSNGNEKK
jgi:hypothetical protein